MTQRHEGETEGAERVLAAPPTSGTTNVGERSMADSMLDLRRSFAPFFLKLVTVSFAMIVVSLLAELAVVFGYHGTNPETAIGEKTLMAHIIRTNVGMILGLVAVSLGVVMTWVAVEAPFNVTARSGGGAAATMVSMKSVGPGLVLITGGLLLIGFSLYAPMTYRFNRGNASSEILPSGERPASGPS